MAEDPLSELPQILPPLFQALEALERVARYFNPPDFAGLMGSIGAPDAALPVVIARIEAWPGEFAPLAGPLAAAARAAASAFEALRSAREMREVFRAMGQLPRAQEALFSLAEGLAPVSRYFLEAEARRGPDRAAGTVLHLDNDRGQRGGVSIFAPDEPAPAGGWPLVVALHGGAGHGRAFLWTWLRAARTFGAVLATPTAVGETWALQGPDLDTPKLARIVDHIESQWPIDPGRRLLTGMSDGGTFTYLAGLTGELPFTHLAPIAAAFHPMLTGFADPGRIRGLPVRITHGVLDWMFPVESAREARDALAAAGAEVSYREIDDLAHAYPREENAPILDWMARA